VRFNPRNVAGTATFDFLGPDRFSYLDVLRFDPAY